jgi:pimeloyl-ACP methyl ester carboxylesterase
LCDWLSDSELKVFETEFQRTGFQGGLNWYRATKSAVEVRDLSLFHGRRIVVPSLFIAGESDWGPFQKPGALQFMEEEVCVNFYGTNFVNGAGHWVQQEQPNVVSDQVLSFLNQIM